LNFDQTSERKSKQEELTRLKRFALDELEQRGYQVRGKTLAQIRATLKRVPNRPVEFVSTAAPPIHYKIAVSHIGRPLQAGHPSF
jgi:hypothetical protein